MKNVMRCYQILLVIIFFLPSTTSAYSVSPSIVTLQSSGSGASAFMRLQNNAILPVALEFTLHQHTKDIDGKSVIGAEATDDFIIYPHQVILIPGDEAAVQLMWIGEPDIAFEKAFTIVTHQVQIPQQDKAEPEVSGGIQLDVKVLINYEGRIYVTPKGATHKVVVLDAKNRLYPAAKDAPNIAEAQMVEVMLSNQGTAHRSLANTSLVFTPISASGVKLKQQNIYIKASDVPAMKPHLLAGTQRRLLLTRPDHLPIGAFEVILSDPSSKLK